MCRLRKPLALTLLFTFITCAGAEDTSPDKVIVGAYVNDAQSLNLREHSYSMDIYVWFRWRDPSFSPTDTVEIVNPNELWGHVRNFQYEEPLQLPSGELYQVLRVQGRFSHKFFFNNFPYDRQKLVVEFEDTVNEINRLVLSLTKNPSPSIRGWCFQASVSAFPIWLLNRLHTRPILVIRAEPSRTPTLVYESKYPFGGPL